MREVKDVDGILRWKMKDDQVVIKDGVEYKFVDREINCQEFAPDVFA